MSRLLPRFTISSHADQLKIEKIIGTKTQGDIVAYQHSPISTTRRRRPRTQIPREQRGSIIERDGSECYLCGRVCDDHEIHIDHVIPVSKGGDNHPTNLRVACSTCNLRKSNKLLNTIPAPIAIRTQKSKQTSNPTYGSDPLRILIDNESKRERKAARRK